MKRAMSFLICLLFVSATVAQKPPVTKPAPKTPAKTAPKALPKDPVLELYERTKKTLTDVLAELERLNRYHNENVAGKPTGEWVSGSMTNKEDWVSKGKVPRDVGTGPIEEVSKYLKANESAFALYKEKKLSAQDLAYRLYGSLTSAINDVWMLSLPRYEAAVISADVDRNRQYRAIEIGNEVMATRPKLNSESEQRAWYNNVGIPKIDAAMDAYLTQLWGESIAQARELRGRVEKARKKWVAELWKYYDFAEAKTASPTDAHARSKESLRSAINGFETETPPLEYDHRFNNGVTIDLSTIAHHYHTSGGALEPFEHAKFGVEPDLQCFKNATALISLTKCLQPLVEKLRGYKEEVEPPAITDAFVLPIVGPGGIPRKGRIGPESIDGSEAYHIFVYGPKLPTKRSQLKGIQGPARGIFYEPIVFAEDAKSATGHVKHLWEQGMFMLTRGVAEPGLTDLKAMPAMIVRAKLTAGVLPGIHTFKINGAGAGWMLDQGTCRAEMSIIRELKDPDLPTAQGEKVNIEQTDLAYKGEAIAVQVKTLIPVDLKEFGIVLGKNGTWLSPDGQASIKARLVPGEQNTYRTGPIYILPEGDERLDPNDPKSGREPGAKYVSVWVGDVLEAILEDQRMFRMSQAGASFRVAPDPPMSLWFDALERAAKAAGQHSTIQNWRTLPGKTAHEVSITPITEVVVRPWVLIKHLYNVSLAQQKITLTGRITIGDHAAMLMLKDHFVSQMRGVKAELDTVDTDQKKLVFLDALGPFIKQVPMGAIEVESINKKDLGLGGDTGGLKTPTKKLAAYYDTSTYYSQAERAWERNAKLSGFNIYKEAVDSALKKAENLQDKDIDGLLELIGSRPEDQDNVSARIIGNGFNAVAGDLVPRLMKPVKIPNGGYRWVPDFPARAALNGLNSSIETIRALKEYDAADTQVVLAAASLAPFAAGAGLGKVALSLAINLLSLYDLATTVAPEIVRQEREYKFALGASSVLGADRFYMADLQRTPTWALALNVMGAVVGAGSTAGEVYVVMSAITKHAAMPLARVLATKINQLGAAAFPRTAPNEQAALLVVGAAADAKEAAKGSSALFKDEEEIRGAIKILAEDAAKKPPMAKTMRLPELEMPKPGQFHIPADDTPLGALTPTEPCKWSAANGKIFDLEKLLSQDTKFFNVFKRRVFDQVVKISKETGDAAKATMEGVQKAVRTCVKKGIRHLEVVDAFFSDERSYVVQKYLKTSFVPGEEKFCVQDWLKRSIKLPNGDLKYYRLTGEMEDAIIELIVDMRNKGVCFEDFKFDNIYIERLGGKNGKLVAGVMDVDRIAEWGDFTWYMNAIATDLEAIPRANGIYSATGNKQLSYEALRHGVEAGAIPVETMDKIMSNRGIRSADEFWQLILERREMVYFNLTTQTFQGGHLPIDKVLKAFPAMKTRGFLRFEKLPRTRPAPPPPAQALLQSLVARLLLPQVGLRPA